MTNGIITIHLDGERMEVREGSTLGSVIPHHPHGCSVAIIRPSTQEQSRTGTLAISTTAGEVAIEIAGGSESFLKSPEIGQKLTLHWEDRYHLESPVTGLDIEGMMQGGWEGRETNIPWIDV